MNDAFIYKIIPEEHSQEELDNMMRICSKYKLETKIIHRPDSLGDDIFVYIPKTLLFIKEIEEGFKQ